MTAESIVAIVAAGVGAFSGIVGPVLLRGRREGEVNAKLVEHSQAIESLQAGARGQGQRLEDQHVELADLRGELRGRGVIGGDYSKAHRSG